VSALFFYPQIPQITADSGGLSCRCAAIHAAILCLLRGFAASREEKRIWWAAGRPCGARGQNGVWVWW